LHTAAAANKSGSGVKNLKMLSKQASSRHESDAP
jgi:hypothetical protein